MMEYKGLYTEIERIGSGNYGKSYSGSAFLVVENSTGKKYVAKHIPTSSLSKENLKKSKQESDLLKTLSHQNIVGFKETMITQDKITIIMEYCEGGDLSKLIKTHAEAKKHFTESQIIIWFSQLVSALDYIHSFHVLHRDIKASNIFISKDGSLKLGDFGISKMLDNSNDVASTMVGTPLYMSPEICEGQNYASKSDIWSMGCVFYEICCLRLPFVSTNLLNLISRITQDAPDPLPLVYSEQVNDIVLSMLIKDSDARISTKELLSCSLFTEFFYNPVQSVNTTLIGTANTFINPLDLYGQDTYVSVNDIENDVSRVNLNESIEDYDIPQDERIDDEKFVIQGLEVSNFRLSQKKNAASGVHSEIVDIKKSIAYQKFQDHEFNEIYEYLKFQRMSNEKEDIVKVI